MERIKEYSYCCGAGGGEGPCGGHLQGGGGGQAGPEGHVTIDDGVILVPEYGGANPCDTGFIFSPDLGKTWAQYDLAEFGPRSPCRFDRMNSEGWFRVDLRTYWVTPAEVMFIKPK